MKYHPPVPDVRLNVKVKAELKLRPKLSVGSEAWLTLHRYFTRQKPRMERIATELELTGMQAFALYLLEEPMPMGELAVRMGCDNSNVTGIVDRLESRGLIERRPAPDDRRIRLLVLSPAGEKLRARGLELFAAPPPGIASLSKAEQRTLQELLEKALAAEQD